MSLSKSNNSQQPKHDRGKLVKILKTTKCLKTRPTLASPWYPPGDQIVHKDKNSLSSGKNTPRTRCIYGAIGTINIGYDRWLAIAKR